MRYLYHFTPKSALSLHVRYNFEQYGGVTALENAIGPRVDLVRDARYHFSDMPGFITVALGLQFKLLPRKRGKPPIAPVPVEGAHP